MHLYKYMQKKYIGGYKMHTTHLRLKSMDCG